MELDQYMNSLIGDTSVFGTKEEINNRVERLKKIKIEEENILNNKRLLDYPDLNIDSYKKFLELKKEIDEGNLIRSVDEVYFSLLQKQNKERLGQLV